MIPYDELFVTPELNIIDGKVIYKNINEINIISWHHRTPLDWSRVWDSLSINNSVILLEQPFNPLIYEALNSKLNLQNLIPVLKVPFNVGDNEIKSITELIKHDAFFIPIDDWLNCEFERDVSLFANSICKLGVLDNLSESRPVKVIVGYTHGLTHSRLFEQFTNLPSSLSTAGVHGLGNFDYLFNDYFISKAERIYSKFDNDISKLLSFYSTLVN